MNIFFLDVDVKKAAEYHVDRHCIKMRLELAQLGCTAHHVLGDIETNKIPYKKTHFNHPSAIWVRESLFNYNHIVDLGLALCAEMRYRFGTPHQKAEEVLNWLKNNPIQVENVFMTKPKLALTGVPNNEYFPQDEMDFWDYAVKNYCKYYELQKSHLFKWSNRKAPEWLIKNN